MTETSSAGPAGYYSPEPRHRPSWSQAEWDAARDPSGWQASHPNDGGDRQGGRGPQGGGPYRPPRSTGMAGLLLAVALLAAILSSGGTYLALTAAGLPQRTPSVSPGATLASETRPVTIDESSAIVDAAAMVSPAVVTITSVSGFDPNDPFSLPATGVGSGVIFDAAGWIVTNRHVVEGGEKLTVALKDGRTFEGRVYGIDTLTDLAIVKIEETDLPTAAIGDSSELKPGQLVAAIGSPLGTYTNSVTSGIVSALGRRIDVTDAQGRPVTLHNLIQTDAAINPGNSGGALVDAAGNVIGINTAVARSAQGIGFAIPINIARPIMRQAVAGKTLARPYIGIRFLPVDAQLAGERKLSIDYGALLEREQGSDQPAVVPDSPADRAGVREGDLLTAIDGQRIDANHTVEDLLSLHEPGDTVTLDLLRDGKTMRLELILGTRPADL